MPKDALAELKRKPNDSMPIKSSEDLAAELRKQQMEDQKVQVVDTQSELESLRSTITSQSSEIEKLKEVAANQKVALSIEQATPETLQRIWNIAYESAVKSIFIRDLSFYNTKGDQLKRLFQLAVIRADEAVENFISVRKSCPDPVQRQLQDWQKNKG